MASNKNITMRQYNGTDYDTLYPATTSEQIIGDISADKISGNLPSSQVSGNFAASRISAGTFAGQVVANSSQQAPATSLVRNSKLVSSESTPTVNGEIFWQYE